MGDSGHGDARPRWFEPFIHVRNSFGRFDDRQVPEKCIRQILELAQPSPIQWYFQPWRWILVRSQAGKEAAESATYVDAPLSLAPLVLICLADSTAWKTSPQQVEGIVAKERLSAEAAREILRKIREQHTSAPERTDRAALTHAFVALHQILIAAAACELSAYWVSAFDEQKIRAYFHIPDQFFVAALLAIGYAAQPLPAPLEPSHWPLVYQEKFGDIYDSINREQERGFNEQPLPRGGP